MYPLALLFYSCLLALILPSNSLQIHLHDPNNQTTAPITLKYTYTTLGTPPKLQFMKTSPVFLASYNFSDCKFAQTTNTANLQGKIIVLESLPFWYDCAYEEHGAVTAAGRLIQREGGIGVVITAQEKVRVISLFSTK
jgi:hypothetical protein